MQQSRLSTVLLVIALVLCVLGAAVSAVLMQHHIIAQISGDPLLGAACNPTEAASCDEVISSKWGKIEIHRCGHTLIIPTAALGFFFFASLGSWFLAVGVPTGKRRWLHVLPTLATFAGVVGCAGFEYIMFAKIGKYCPLCMTTHAATLALFAVTLLLWKRRPTTPAIVEGQTVRDALLVSVQASSPTGRMVLTAVVLAISTSALGWSVYAYRLKSGYAAEYLARWQHYGSAAEAATQAAGAATRASGEYFARWQDYDKDTRLQYNRFLATPAVNIPIHPDDPVLGPADSKFTVVLFSDFLCPACKMLNGELDKRLAEFPGRFRIIYKHFPLDTSCNKEIKTMMHPGACAAAVASEGILKLKGNDAFWKMHDAFFHATKFTATFAFEQAEALGVDKEAFTNRIQTYSAWDRIRRNLAEAKALGVTSTPVIYFNNRPLKPWGDRHMWQYLLSDETLAATSTRPASSVPSTQPASAPAGTQAAVTSQPASQP